MVTPDRLTLARREEAEAAAALHDCRTRGNVQDYARALQWHLRCVTHRMLAEQAEKRQQQAA